MLEFITGPSGSGKSFETVSRAVKCAKENRVILLVPEQFSFETERAVFELMGGERTENIEVLSFTRLCNRIFRRCGGLAGDYIDDSARIILMDTALNEIGDMLEYYSDSVKSTAFISSALAFVTEMKNAGATPEELLDIADANDSSLSLKLRELALIAETYSSLVDRSYLDSRDDLARACELLYESENGDFFKGAHIFIDGFKDFTAAELKMVEIMLSDAELVCVSLCCDVAAEDDGMSVFAPALKTKKRLEALALKNDVQIGETQSLKRSVRYSSKRLAHIEKTFLQSKSDERLEDDGSVSVLEAANIYDETEAVAAEIMRLVSNGARFRDFVIISRSVSDYEQAVESVFYRYSIPVFFDRRSEIMSRPIVTVILSALNAVRASSGLDTLSVLSMLKTGFVGFSDDETAMLENYCFIWDIRGEKWEREFTENPSGVGSLDESDRELLNELEALRKRVAEPLFKLKDALSDCDGECFARAVYEFLEEINVRENAEKHAEMLKELGEKTYCAEDATLWDAIIAILEQFATALSGVYLSKRRFTELFELVVSKVDIGKIPQTADQVLFGQADRIRPNNPKYVFVIGANEGIFPARGENSSLLTDSERKELIGAGIALSSDLEESVLEERYFAYVALSAPTDRLYVSYSKSALSGAGMTESLIVRQVMAALPDLEIKRTSQLLPDFYIRGRKSAFDVLTRNYSQKDNLYISSLNSAVREDGEYSDTLDRIDESVLKCGHRIENTDVARALFGENIRLSPSKLDRFYGCRFSYFCYDGLGLRTRRKAALSPIESGTLIHYVLEHMIRSHGAEGLGEIDDMTLKKEVDELLNKWIDENMGAASSKNNRIKYLLFRLSRTLIRIIKRLAEEFSQSEFEPKYFEMEINRKSEVKSIKMELPSGGEITLEGVVDRVDIMEKNGAKYVRVVDYKSGSRTFNLSDVLYGLNMQMLVYLFSICDSKDNEFEGAIPAGVLYVPAKENIISAERTDSEDAIESGHRKKLRMNGLLLENLESVQGMERDVAGAFIPAKLKANGQFDAYSSVASLSQLGQLKKYVEDTIIKMGELLHSGDIDDVPAGHAMQLPCGYCDFKAICAHSKNNRENIIGNMSIGKVFDRIDEELGADKE